VDFFLYERSSSNHKSTESCNYYFFSSFLEQSVIVENMELTASFAAFAVSPAFWLLAQLNLLCHFISPPFFDYETDK